MKKISYIISLFVITIMISGCLEPETPQSYISAHNDKEMAKGFSKLLGESGVYTYSKKNTLRVKTNIVSFSQQIPLGNVRNYLMENGADNIIFTTYKDVVKKRGNILAIYKGKLNRHIFEGISNNKIKNFDDYYKEFYYYDTLPVLIEFDKGSNEMVSILYSYAKISAAFNQVNDPYAPADGSLEAYIQSGSKLNIIKNLISNKVFEDNLIRKSN